MKLSEDVLNRITLVMQHLDGALTFEELVEKKRREHLTEWLRNTARSFPDYSTEERTAMAFAQWLQTYAVERGIARRLHFDVPAELATCVSLEARLHWIWCGFPGVDDYPNVWPVLRALSAGDFTVAHRFTETGRYPITHCPDIFSLLYNAVFAVLRKDMDYLQTLVPTMLKRKPPLWVAAMYSCLFGIAQDSPELVAEGLVKVLRTNGRRQDVDLLKKTIYLEAHGLYELCRWVSPDLVAGFDVVRPLPWDTDYCQWIRAHGDPLEYLQLEKISPILHAWVTTLPEPTWWKQFIKE